MFINQLKTVVLFALITAILLAIGFLTSGFTGLIIALVIAITINVLVYCFSDKAVRSLYKAKPAPGSQYPQLHNIVREISTKAALPKPEVYIIQEDNPNAFTTGRNPKNSAITVTSGLLNLLDEDELRGVIAHEISHIKNHDVLISTIAAALAGAIAYITIHPKLRPKDKASNSGTIFGVLLLAILAPLLVLIIRTSISRSREFLADETGSRIIRDPIPLANALAKLNIETQTKPMNGHEATAHMFIVNPFSKTTITNLFSTHPPIHIRIGKLRTLKF